MDNKLNQNNYRAEKLRMIRKLESEGVLRELCPMHNGHCGTAYWRFEVVGDIANIPEVLATEVAMHGEVRW